MAKETCAVCDKKTSKLTRRKIKDGDFICNDCYVTAFSFKEQIKNNDKDLTVEEIKDKIEENNNMPEPESKWDKISEKLIESGDKSINFGEKLGEKSKAIRRAGYHTTAAVWVPPLYIGYRVIKKRKKNKQHDSINSPEDHLIAFIRECEQAYKEGKIDEETMKEYIVDFTNKFYRMDDESLDS
ncbi:DUF4428 domain-containing protein [Oceanobacillus sp. FSL W7-1293]|uniref:DUF4428 domain-containing protein n=1 Tax=Oceanobacillus sp. FSL W7-1293 TaxID=2921699 RepID=UPI0030D34777